MIDTSLNTLSDPLNENADDLLSVENAIAAEAQTIDESSAFPQASIKLLADAGLLDPAKLEKSSNWELYEQLAWTGRVSLTVGRLFEGHVNGIVLLKTYGNSRHRELIRAESLQGRITGVWNAERGPGLSVRRSAGGWVLNGTKIFCSGAGAIRHAIVTARLDETDKVLMTLPDLNSPQVTVDVSKWLPSGMRGTATGTVTFDQLFISEDAIIGQAGDYYRSPLFSGGAWRVLAVQLGGLQHILALHAQRLIDWERFNLQNVQARFAVATQQLELARLLVTEAAKRAASSHHDPAAIDAYVDGARSAFETLAWAVIENTRRNIGLSTYLRPDALDLVIRDLETYLRQPFLDASSNNAAEFLLHRKGSFEP